MLKTLSLFLCLSACAANAAAADKGGSKQHKPGPVQQEFGKAERAAERRAREQAKEQREESRRAETAAARLPPPTPATTTPADEKAAAALFNQTLLPPFTETRKLPDKYQRHFHDPNRATDPAKVQDRKAYCREHKCEPKRAQDGRKTILLKDDYTFPVRRGATVYDALGNRIGGLASTTRMKVQGRVRDVPQQISINKNEGQMLKLGGGHARKFEMALGVKLTNGKSASGLVRRTDILAGHRPSPYRPKRAPAPGGATAPFYIEGGASARALGLVGKDPRTGRLVPLKFGNEANRGYTKAHHDVRDYLPRSTGNGEAYINLLGSKLPGGGGGGVARTVVKVNRNDQTPPIFDVLVGRAVKTRKLYEPGGTQPVGSIDFVPGRLRGAGRDSGLIYIARPNLSPLPAQVRRH
ncbi:MAG: hypothetical protein JOZ96_03860 [Acidobacteria bacterium]|nr:hypothetical protein [Acidobacteriota bacterium]